ncbi:hypothetical protein GH714_008412 [Hevea brasiliensis]|uniref:Uncharacterized protein n=1 Tax=Hevea brasiliensis TaxID=3981 RepID=A0A6A6LWK8_HEVBR|nr:hypothetical protein GH714_008412 [Hevea brasiliensis]
MQLLDFPFLHFAFKLDNFEHATMFLHLAIFAGFTLSAEITQSSEILSGVIGILAASVFGQELFLLHFHSTDHVGLEGHYHWLLQLVAVLVYDQGFVLWVPEFMPEGCAARFAEASTHDMHGAVTCGSIDADLRARALANLQFSWTLSGILLFMGVFA